MDTSIQCVPLVHRKYKYVRLEVPVVVLKIHTLSDIMLCQHGVACRRPESSKRLIWLLVQLKNLFKNDYLR